jgi:uncharacterized protein (TIGR02996 family)
MAALPDEQAALLRAIVAHPDDDTPRLVYADWLEEHGDAPGPAGRAGSTPGAGPSSAAEQAGFIRDSIKLAGMKKRAKGRAALVERLQALAFKRCDEWYGPLGITDDVAIDRYNRGFPYRITFMEPDSLFAAADTVFEFVPIRGLGVMTIEGSAFTDDTLPRFAAMPGLARLTDLRLYEHAQINPEAWGELFRSPHLSGLTLLYLTGCGIYGAEAAELAAAPPLANLTELDLSFNSIGAKGAQALLDSPYLTKLKTLWLDHNFFGEEEGEDEVLEAWEKRLGDGLHVHDSPDEDEEESM